jgi:hypothetical protein
LTPFPYFGRASCCSRFSHSPHNLSERASTVPSTSVFKLPLPHSERLSCFLWLRSLPSLFERLEDLLPYLTLKERVVFFGFRHSLHFSKSEQVLSYLTTPFPYFERASCFLWLRSLPSLLDRLEDSLPYLTLKERVVFFGFGHSPHT